MHLISANILSLLELPIQQESLTVNKKINQLNIIQKWFFVSSKTLLIQDYNTSDCSGHIRRENLVTPATTNSVAAAVTSLIRHCGLYEYGSTIAGKRDGYGRAHMIALRQEESMPVGAEQHKERRNCKCTNLHHLVAQTSMQQKGQRTRGAYGGTSKLDCPSVVESPTAIRKAGRRTFMLTVGEIKTACGSIRAERVLAALFMSCPPSRPRGGASAMLLRRALNSRPTKETTRN